jgi:hypothetical protein
MPRDDSSRTHDEQQLSDDGTLGRRSYLRATAAAAVPVAGVAGGSGVATAATTGYGADGYGAAGYGGAGGFTVTTDAPTDVGTTSATLNGTLDDLGGASSADCYFEWRETGADTWTSTPAQTLSATGSYSESLTGLADGVEYEHRTVADASDGDASTGTTVSLTTGDDPPTVSTGSATDVTGSTATLNGTLDDLGGASSADCHFEWRETGADTWTSTPAQTLSATGSYSESVTGLNEETEYEYQAVVEASDGDASTGTTATWTTTDNRPVVSTGSATDVTGSTATLNGTLDDLGGASSADCHFEWRETGTDTWTTTPAQTLSATGSYSESVDGLPGDTDHEYRAVAVAADGDVDTAAAVSFTTTSADTVPAVDSYAVTEAGSPNPHAEITADWSVSDADGDLERVVVAVLDASGTVVDEARTGVGGSDASGTDSFKIKKVRGATFDVRLTVTDVGGNTTEATRTVTE